MNHSISKPCLKKILSFFTMSQRYFYVDGHSTSCPLCARGPPTLLHLFTNCSATRAICNQHRVPMDQNFLRIFLLQRTGRELAFLVDAFVAVLSQLSRAALADPLVTVPSAIAPDVVTLDTRDFRIRFDRSFMADVGSGIGVTLGYYNSPTHIARFSIPTTSTDA